MLEEAVHFFDIVMWYFEDHGYPETVTATGNARTRQPGLYENFTCTLRWANGSYATITQALGGFENHLLTEIAGTDGAVRAWWSGATDRTRTAQFELKHTQTNSSAVETRSVGPSGEVFELAATYCRINEAFQSKRPLVAGKEAVKSVHVCLEAQRSLTTGQTVTLNF